MADEFQVCPLSYHEVREIWANLKRIVEARKDLKPRQITLHDLVENGFGEKKTFEGFVLKHSSETGQRIVGYAFIIYLFSTWAGPFISVDDMLIFSEDSSYEDHFMKKFIKMSQEQSTLRLDFQVPTTDLDTSRVTKLGAKLKLEWQTIRYTKPTMEALTSLRNEEVQTKFNIRKATMKDLETALYFIQSMAETFDEPDGVKITVEDLNGWYGKNFECFVAEIKSPDTSHPNNVINGGSAGGGSKSSGMPHNPAIVGMSLYLVVFCKRAGRVVHLEDLFVLPGFRGKGIGTELIKETIKAGLSCNCKELDLQVLVSNPRAASLYNRLGGQLDSDYTITRIEREDFEKILTNL